MSLAPKLAFRNLFHDRLRLIATVIGIVFSIVLVTVQMGLYVSFERMVTVMIDHADADLWIVPRGTKCFEDPSLLDERERFRALAVEGVASAVPLVIGFAQWRTPLGRHHADLHDRLRSARRRAAALERDRRQRAMRSPSPAPSPSTAPISTAWRPRGVGDYAEIGDQKVQVLAITNGIRSFTTTPYVFTVDRPRARLYRHRREQGLVFPGARDAGRRRRTRCATGCARSCPMPRC